MLLQIFVTCIVVGFTSFYFYVKYKMTFWQRKGVAQEPGYFPFGSSDVWDLLKRKLALNMISVRAYNHFSVHLYL